MTCEQLVKHCAESVNIGRACDRCVVAYRLFWGHVAGSAQNFHRARDSALCLHQPRKAKIGQMRFALSIKQNVSWFDVAMQDVVFMGIMNGARYLGDQLLGATN